MNTEFKKEVKAVLVLPEQIEAKAREIGQRNYHPIPPRFFLDGSSDFATPGITIRGELMRTAMGQMCNNHNNYIERIINDINDITNALLLQMAKDELGVAND